MTNGKFILYDVIFYQALKAASIFLSPEPWSKWRGKIFERHILSSSFYIFLLFSGSATTLHTYFPQDKIFLINSYIECKKIKGIIIF